MTRVLRAAGLSLGMLVMAAGAARAQEEVRATAPAGAGVLGLRWALDPDFVIRQGEARTRPVRFPTVSEVLAGGPAARAGLRVGDELLSVNGRDGRERALFPNRTPGTRYLVRIRRGDEEREVTLVVSPPAA